MPIRFTTYSRFFLVITVMSCYIFAATIIYATLNTPSDQKLSFTTPNAPLTTLLYLTASIAAGSLLVVISGIRFNQSQSVRPKNIPIQNDITLAVFISAVAFTSTLLFLHRGDDLAPLQRHNNV